MKIVLTGGVTGGHIYPAIAIGDKFKEKDPSNEIIYIASGEPLEKEIISKAGYELFEVTSEPFYRGNIFKLFKTASRTWKGRSEALKIMKEFKPDVLISTGSFVSVPVVLAARYIGARIYLHEQNGYPGISNKAMSSYADKVFLGFESAAEHFKDRSKTKYSGNPVRSEFSGRDKIKDREVLGIPKEDFVIMIFGGSLGACTTNEVAEALVEKYADKDGITIIWGTGRDYYDEIKERLDQKESVSDNIKVMPYISDMPEVLSVSDISISRSGALSVAEITMVGRVAVFIPSPNVTEDHQFYNAKAVADKGGAFIVREEGGVEPAIKEITGIIDMLMEDRKRLRKMEEASSALAPDDAANIIYDTIMADFREHSTEAVEGNESEEHIKTEAPEELEEREETKETEETEETEKIPSAPAAKTITFEKKDIEGAVKEKSEESEDIRAIKHEEQELSPEDLAIAERIRLRKNETEIKKRRLRMRITAVAVVVAAGLTFLILSLTPLFTVDSIEVKGNTHFSGEEIISMGHATPGKNLIYRPEKKLIKEYLEMNPYIEEAVVSRKLPSTLVITVSERTERMALKYDDDYLVLDGEGILLQKTRSRPKLPLIQGNVITRIKPGQKIGTQNEELMNRSIELISRMNENDIYFVKVDMSDLYNVKAYVYDSLIVKNDYETLVENISNGKLHKVLDKLFSESIRRGTIIFNEDGTSSFIPIF